MLYIVHGPAPSKLESGHEPKTSEEIVEAANRDKIAQALERAAIKKIPVVYETLLGDRVRDQGLVESLRRKPEILWVEQNTDLRGILARKKFLPTRFILLGHYRDNCVPEAAEYLRTYFPRAEVYVLEGHSTALYNRQAGQKRHYKAGLKAIGVRFSRSLGKKHFV